MAEWHDIALRKLLRHSKLTAREEDVVRSLPVRTHHLRPDEDLIHQGDRPNAATLVLAGMIARYHSLTAGRRQYLSFHLAGDWPDAQTLFLERIDHSVCALGPAQVASIRHEALRDCFARHPKIGFAFWRETLVDAAIFREAITNNGSRAALTRMAHQFCELFYRAKIAGLVDGNTVAIPLNQQRLGETLGMSLVTVNRVLQTLRRTATMQFKSGELRVLDWRRLAELGDFDPEYLSLATAE